MSSNPLKQTCIDDLSATIILDSRESRLLVLKQQVDALIIGFYKEARKTEFKASDRYKRCQNIYNKLKEAMLKYVLLLKK